MKHSVNRDLHRYWDRLRDGRTAPERSEIDPAAIRHVLAYTFVLGVSGSPLSGRRDVSFRLCGTRLNALFGRDLKGGSFASIWSPEDAGSADALLDVALDDRAAVVAGGWAGPPDHEPIAVELLLLPLRHHGKTHARLLGSLAPAANPGWMGLRPVEPLRLASFRSMPGSPSRPAKGLTGLGSADTNPSKAMPPSMVTQVGPFRVYEGGRGVGASAQSLA